MDYLANCMGTLGLLPVSVWSYTYRKESWREREKEMEEKKVPHSTLEREAEDPTVPHGALEMQLGRGFELKLPRPLNFALGSVCSSGPLKALLPQVENVRTRQHVAEGPLQKEYVPFRPAMLVSGHEGLVGTIERS